MSPFHHPACNSALGPPVGMTENDCGTLPILRETNPPSVSSFWTPDPHELHHLNQGGSVMLRVTGTTHPPLSMQVATSTANGDPHTERHAFGKFVTARETSGKMAIAAQSGKECTLNHQEIECLLDSLPSFQALAQAALA